jgi:predicted glycogen debranching enzyme
MPRYSIETYGELEPHLGQEWLVTNGIGGFAAGTVVGCNTRRYHGLLCAATVPPVGRIMTLNRLAETITAAGGKPLELSVNVFQDSLAPRGDRFLRRFEVDDCVRWEYEAEGVKLVKELCILWQRNTVVVRYHLDGGGRNVELSIQPFVSLRDFHGLRQRAGGDLPTREIPHGVAVSDRDLTLHIKCDRAAFSGGTDWWFRHKYPLEAERGLNCFEDLYSPGKFVMTSDSPATLMLWASLEAIDGIDFDGEIRRSVEGCMPTVGAAGAAAGASDAQRRLARAAGDFIVSRHAPDGSQGVSVIAGYPWFADWGRDTMIALPGLLLATRRFDEAGRVLATYAGYVSEGMIPNHFDDYTNEPHYNTVDASLWFVHAAHEYLRISKDRDTFESHLRPACEAILDGYAKGTRFKIGMDPTDGLITQGDATTQLTWMDAKCGDVAFTPRQGKAVEINALWYNALKLCGRDELAERVAKSFAAAYWISPFRGLCDVVNGTVRDQSLRPNQIFAVSLPHSPLPLDQQRAVVEVVRRELLTPYGLRTLGPGEKNYHAQYTGDQFHRDEAYHNGTVWPWLIGPFLSAYLRVAGRSADSLQTARTWLRPLVDSMQTLGCIGQIAEIFEAQPPHRPVGCFAQAWSVSEVLRLAVELEM